MNNSPLFKRKPQPPLLLFTELAKRAPMVAVERIALRANCIGKTTKHKSKFPEEKKARETNDSSVQFHEQKNE
jgi:hypothetical protein